jgi:hypothetical protein
MSGTSKNSDVQRGITLIEMLIAMALTLLVMAAVVNVFDMMATGVSGSRATLEMADRMRFARNRLQRDLQGVTCPTLPWIDPNTGQGYFEYIEGIRDDADGTTLPTAGLVNVSETVLGDYDDVLMFTARSRDEPFVGRINNMTVESDTAEIIWWAVENPNTGLRTIYRRVFLVAPWIATFNAGDDISWHVDPANSSNRIPNTLSDLSKRENRTGHSGTFPHAFTPGTSLVPLAGSRLGEDVMLSGVVAWDIQAFDPLAEIYEVPGQAGAPTNPDPSTVIMDGQQASFTGSWGTGTYWPNYYGPNYHHDNNNTAQKGSASARYSPSLDAAAEYEVYEWHTVSANRATNTPIDIMHDGGTTTVTVNQTANGGQWNFLGSWAMTPGSASLTIRTTGTAGTNKYVEADGIRWVPVPGTWDPGGGGGTSGYLLAPTDKGWPGTGSNKIGAGAFVDLGYSSSGASSQFSSTGQTVSGGGDTLAKTWDTWPIHYESDGANQDGLLGIDQGTNGLDDGGSSAAVDDAGERETRPPYPVPLRGVRATMRVYEPDSRQLRQVSVIHNFVPE